MIFLILVLLVLAVLLFGGGKDYLESSAISSLSDDAYPDHRKAERRMSLIIGLISMAAAGTVGAVAVACILRLLP